MAVFIRKVLSDLEIAYQSYSPTKPITPFQLLCKYGIILTILILFCPFLSPGTEILHSSLLSCLFSYIYIYKTMIIKSTQKQDILGSILLVSPFVKHLFCVATFFALLFIFTWRFWRENIPLLLQTKLHLVQTGCTYLTSQKTNFKEMLRNAIL